jgi:hypothetical protein
VSNTFYQVNADEPDKIFRVRGVSGESVVEQQELLSAYFLSAANQVADPGFMLDSQQMYLVPAESFIAPAWFDPGNPYIQNAGFAGAFKAYNWLSDWSLLSQSGIFMME